MIRRVLPVALIAWALLAATAHAANTTITFDGLAAGTEIRDQYLAQGVVFGDAAAFGFGESSAGCTPAAPVAAGGAAAVGYCGGAAEFPRFASMGAFNSFRSSVSLRVFSDISSTETVVLRAYGVRRNLIATSDPQPVTVAGRTVALSLGTPQIAFFSIERTGTSSTAPRIDDFTYDNPPVPPDPQIALGVEGAGFAARLRQGGSADVKLRILRFNGSIGDVGLSVAGVPDGVATSTFTPNPAGGSQFVTTATLKLTAFDAASTGRSTPTITASPTGGAGSTPDSASFNLDIVPPFRLSLAATGRVAPCTPTSVPLSLDAEPGFTAPISLKITSMRGTVRAALPATFTPGFSPAIDALPLEAVPGTGKTDDDQLTVEARSGSFVVERRVDVDRYPGSIDAVKVAAIADINAGPVIAPRLGHEGTYLRVLGSGFCADSKLFFGAGDSQGAPLESRAADGRSAYVRMPRTAVTGSPSLVNSDSDGRNAAAVRFAGALTVSDYRNTLGLSFANFTSSGPSWGDVVDLYGKAETTIEIDPCGDVTFGLVDCTIKTGIPRPDAFIYWRSIHDYGEKGNCYGLVLASYRLWSRRQSAEGFPPGGATWPFELDGPAGPSAALRAYVRQMMLVQSASQTLLLRAASVGKQSQESMRAVIEGALRRGHPAMMSLKSGDSGHAVLAYDVVSTPAGYDIETYNPNKPELPTELGSAAIHDDRLEKSRIHVSNGQWSFSELGWSGGFDKIGAYDIDSIPNAISTPTSVVDLLIMISNPDATGVTAVTGPAGKPIAGATRLPAETGAGVGPMTDVIPDGRAVRATLSGRGGTVGLFGGARSFALDGQAKALSLDVAGHVLGVEGAAGATKLSATVRVPGGSRAATAALTGARGADYALGFGSGSALTVRATSAASLDLTLGQVRRRGSASVTVRGLRLRAGETASVRPGSWSRPSAVSVTVRGRHGATRRLTLRARRAAAAVAVRALRLRATSAKGSATVRATGRLKLPAAAAATGTLIWQAQRGGRTVRRGNVALSTEQVAAVARGAGVTFTVRAPKGRYTVRAALVLGGAMPGSAVPSVSGRKASTTALVR